MIATALWWSLAFLGFILLIWYFDTVLEMYQNWKASKQSKQARDNERFIQKVDRYYHEV